MLPPFATSYSFSFLCVSEMARMRIKAGYIVEIAQIISKDSSSSNQIDYRTRKKFSINFLF